MSADNYIAVFSTKDMLGRDLRWYVSHGMMSSIETPSNEEDWQKSIVDEANANGEWYIGREAALIAAHDMMKADPYPVEYGVIEL